MHTEEQWTPIENSTKSLYLSYSIYNEMPATLQGNIKERTMSDIKRIEIGTRMSKIVINNGVIYLAGQVADNAEEGIKEQTENMLAKVEKLLAEAGSDIKHILSATIYIRDMKDFAQMNEIWDAWIPEGHAPARACVEARLARPELLVEVSIVAAQK